MYTIGETSRILNISIQAIHLYQKWGLITPNYINPQSGYRYFDDKNIEELYDIKMLQHAGFSLKEIKSLSNINEEDKLLLLDKKTKELDDHIKNLNTALNYLKDKSHGLRLINTREDISEIKVKYYKDRAGSLVESSDDRSMEEHLKQIHILNKSIDVDNEISYTPCRYMKISKDQFTFIGLLALTNKSSLVKKDAHYFCVKGGTYITMLFKGSKLKDEERKKLFSYIRENNYHYSGDALIILHLDKSKLVSSNEVLREIQIAVY